MGLFVFDRLIDASEFCNFKQEREKLFNHIQNGHCVKLFAPRNFGKTSLIKNIVSVDWQELNPEKRVVVYIELYSVRSLEDISAKFTQAFNKALSGRKSTRQLLTQIAKVLKSVRPTWKPPNDDSSFGEFSIVAESGSKVVHFEEIFDQIQLLQESGTLEFLLLFDEFQEVAHIPQAEARLRDSLQKLSAQMPVVICGSKEHLLQKIFNEPRRPFYKWGSSVELKQIPENEYTDYINEKFAKVHLRIEPEASAHLQRQLNHIPEQINRVCDFAASYFMNKTGRKIETTDIDHLLKTFVSESEALYAIQFAQLSATERAVVLAFAHSGSVEKTNSKVFLALIPSLTAAAVNRIVARLLDAGVLQRFENQKKIFFRIEDPLFAIYIQETGMLLSLPQQVEV